MTRSGILALIAIVLAAYGVYVALYLPAMLVGPPMALLVIAFVVQVVCAFLAAIGLWTDGQWAAVCLVLLGASIAATQLIEVLLGILPYMRAVLVGVLAIVGTLVVAAYVSRLSVASAREGLPGSA